MSAKNTLDILKQEVVIPDIVQNKANDAFSKIHQEAEKNAESSQISQSSYSYRKNKKKFFLTILVAALLLGTLSASASVYYNWHEILGKESQSTSVMSDTDAGVTVTVQKSVADNYYAFLSFKVEGYQPPENKQPAFQNVTYSIEDTERVSSGRDFSRNQIVKEDGTIGSNCIMEDGSMEYQIYLFSGGRKDIFQNKTIHIEFQNLGYFVDKTGNIEVEVKGTWTLDWEIQEDRTVTVELDEPLSNTGITLLEAEISPISLRITYNSPFIVWKTMPLCGVRLKDGTLLTGLSIKPDVCDRHETRFPIDRVLDIDEVDGLLFVSSYPEPGETLTEENLYIVDLP